MKTTRREFVQLTAMAGVAYAIGANGKLYAFAQSQLGPRIRDSGCCQATCRRTTGGPTRRARG